MNTKISTYFSNKI